MVRKLKCSKIVFVVLINIASFVSLRANADTVRIWRELDLAVSLHLQAEGSPPRSWGEIDIVRMMNDGSLKPNRKLMEGINSFALVPDAPKIDEDDGTLRKYWGLRVFAISRHKELSGSNEEGRFAILIGPKLKEPAGIRTMTYFIAEDNAQAIFEKLNKFDPVAEPLAFEEVPSTSDRPRSTGEAERIIEESEKDKTEVAVNVPTEEGGRAESWIPILTVAFLTLVAGIIFVGLRRSTREKH